MNRYTNPYQQGMQQGRAPQNWQRQSANSAPMVVHMREAAEPEKPPKPFAEELDGFPVAMAYVPWQNWKTVYEMDTGFCKGTIFPALDLPFCAYRGAEA